MRIKLDVNLPTSLVEALVQLGHDADSVQQKGLGGFVVATDTKIRVRRPEPDR